MSETMEVVNDPDKRKSVEPELVIKMQTNTEGIPGEDMNSEPLKPPLKEEESDFNLKSEIEIEEDMIFKTESADLSEFIQETNNDSVDVMTGHVDVDDESRRKEEEEEFSNRVTMEEFLPHLSGCQDYSSEKDFQYLSMFK